MEFNPTSSSFVPMDLGGSKALPLESKVDKRDPEEVRNAFNQFVGETFFTQMLSSMRKTLGKPAYFHGGQAEEIFQGQLDQVLAEKLTEASGESFADPMFELFMANRK